MPFMNPVVEPSPTQSTLAWKTLRGGTSSPLGSQFDSCTLNQARNPAEDSVLNVFPTMVVPAGYAGIGGQSPLPVHVSAALAPDSHLPLLQSPPAGGFTGVMAMMDVAVPPVKEQREIVVFLDRETMRIDSLILESETAVDLLSTRRASLISSAVTGQIDVRDFLPEPVA